MVYRGSTTSLLKCLFLYFHFREHFGSCLHSTASFGKLLFRLFYSMTPKYLLRVVYFWDIVHSPVNMLYSLCP